MIEGELFGCMSGRGSTASRRTHDCRSAAPSRVLTHSGREFAHAPPGMLAGVPRSETQEVAIKGVGAQSAGPQRRAWVAERGVGVANPPAWTQTHPPLT